MNYSNICIHDYMIKDIIMVSYYLGQPQNEFKGNKSVGKSRKVNPAILYRNELDPEKQTITQEYMANDSQGTKSGKYKLYGVESLKDKMHFQFVHLYALFDNFYVIFIATCLFLMICYCLFKATVLVILAYLFSYIFIALI